MKFVKNPFPAMWRLYRSMPLTVKLGTLWIVAIVLGAIFADFLPLKDPNYQGFIMGESKVNEGPSFKHLLGTDDLSRDLFSRIVYGARVSLTVSFVAVVAGSAIGGFLGALVTFMQTRSLFVISVIVGFLSIPPYTRVARANSLSISRREFVLAARAIGTPRRTVLFREVIPNVLPSIMAYALVAAAGVIVLEGSLAFLGLSVQPPTPTWGGMINQARKDIKLTLFPVLVPSGARVFTVLALNTVGDWVRKRGQVRGAAL